MGNFRNPWRGNLSICADYYLLYTNNSDNRVFGDFTIDNIDSKLYCIIGCHKSVTAKTVYTSENNIKKPTRISL